MKKAKIIISIVVLLSIGLIIYSNAAWNSPIIRQDIFKGFITNVPVEAGLLEGAGVYDKSCLDIGGGMVQCDAGIQTEEGLLNFKYSHDMMAQQCIAPRDKLKVEIIDSSGKARVIRE